MEKKYTESEYALMLGNLKLAFYEGDYDSLDSLNASVDTLLDNAKIGNETRLQTERRLTEKLEKRPIIRGKE